MKLIQELIQVQESSLESSRYTVARAICADFKNRLTQRDCAEIAAWLQDDVELSPKLAVKLQQVTREEDLEEIRDELYREYVKMNEDARLKIDGRDSYIVAARGAAKLIKGLNLQQAKLVAKYALGELKQLDDALEDRVMTALNDQVMPSPAELLPILLNAGK